MDDVQEGSENNGPEELLSETTIGLTTNMEIESKFELPCQSTLPSQQQCQEEEKKSAVNSDTVCSLEVETFESITPIVEETLAEPELPSLNTENLSSPLQETVKQSEQLPVLTAYGDSDDEGAPLVCEDNAMVTSVSEVKAEEDAQMDTETCPLQAGNEVQETSLSSPVESNHLLSGLKSSSSAKDTCTKSFDPLEVASSSNGDVKPHSSILPEEELKSEIESSEEDDNKKETVQEPEISKLKQKISLKELTKRLADITHCHDKEPTEILNQVNCIKLIIGS